MTEEEALQARLATKQLRDICSSKQEPDMIAVAQLVQSGADVNDTDYSGRGLLHELVDTSHKELARYLIGKGANLEQRTPGNLNNTPLLYATWSRPNAEMAKLFIENGASMWAQDSVGDTALHNAGLKNMADVAAHALAIREDIRVAMGNSSKRSALGNAVNTGSPETAETMINAGWPIDDFSRNHVPYSYPNADPRYKKTTDIVRKALHDAHDRWLNFWNERGGDVSTLTREDICSFANIDVQDEIFRPAHWNQHREALSQLLSTLPPWLSRHIITNQPALLGMMSHPDKLVESWDSTLEGCIEEPPAKGKSA